MSSRLKTFVFFFLIFVFIIFTPSVILYSQGYRFDFEQKRLTKTGGIFIKAEPKKAWVKLDGKEISQTDLFFGSVLIENVLPGEHTVQVGKEGYLPWEKKLLVQASKVTEAKEIKLIQENIIFQELSNQVQKFFIAPKLDQGLFWEKDGSLKLYNFKTGVKSQVLDRKDIPILGQIELLEASFSKDGSKILITFSGKDQLNFFLLELSLPPKLKKLSFISSQVQEVFLNPVDFQKAVAIIDGSFFNVDLNRAVVDKEPFLKNIVAFALKDDILYGLDQKGQLLSYSFLNNTSQFLSVAKLDIGQGEISRNLEVQGNLLFFKRDQTLYYLDLEKKASWQEIDKNITAYSLSFDRKKIAFSKANELWVLFLQDVFSQPERKKGEKVFITRLSAPINKIIWLTNAYLLLEAQGHLSITELDNRDRAQIWPVGSFLNPEIFFDSSSQTIYLKQNTTFSGSLSIF